LPKDQKPNFDKRKKKQQHQDEQKHYGQIFPLMVFHNSKRKPNHYGHQEAKENHEKAFSQTIALRLRS
jgi:hypothetical protein